ncbi:MAG: AmmeMemoRadiSam system radical SAM enzyme [Candidatus Zixiibacteriota bacterium]|nr:MAG: AmmeMemoRadiSam system radical SAM enzyme [candidate division Zixibacteria bacterium]
MKHKFPRRDFLAASASACALAACPLRGWMRSARAVEALPEAEIHLHPALHWEKQPGRRVKCTLCPRECLVDDLERGYCGVRENRGGDYFTLVYGRPCTLHLDPVEKKPMFHFLPGTAIFSLATVGCNVNCKFCQNWQISQVRPEQEKSWDAPPEKIVELARQQQAPSLAHTYTEPVVFYEYAKEIGREAHKHNLKNVVISNGYIQEKPLLEWLPFLDAVKIDLKAFTERFYQDLVNGELQPVLDTLKRLVRAGMWTEIVYLVIPTHNDGEAEIREMSRWVAGELGPEVPVHFTRFHPQYMMKALPPTPVDTLTAARDLARAAGLHYVYVGNVPGHPGEHTYCPGCQTLLIRRSGFRVEFAGFSDGKCARCGRKIPGIWS